MAITAVTVNWGWSQMEELLQCPVCYELPMGSVFMCDQGHHVCMTCREKLQTCPLCKSSFYGTRNYVMEELMANITAIKELMTVSSSTSSSNQSSPETSESGAPAVKKKKEQKARTVSLIGPPPQCKGLFPCRVTGCEEKLAVSRMLNHIRFSHRNILHEAKLNMGGDTYTQIWEMRYAQDAVFVNIIRIEKMGLFFVTTKVLSSGGLQVFVQMVASHTAAQQYQYTIRIPTRQENIFQAGRINSCREPMIQMVHKGLCLAVSSNTMETICHGKDHFMFHLTIRHIGPPTQSNRIPAGEEDLEEYIDFSSYTTSSSDFMENIISGDGTAIAF